MLACPKSGPLYHSCWVTSRGKLYKTPPVPHSVVWASSLLAEQRVLWAQTGMGPVPVSDPSPDWSPSCSPAPCRLGQGGWRSCSPVYGQILHLKSQWLTGSLGVTNEKSVSVAINERQWMDPVWQQVSFWTCTHLVFTQTFCADL